MRCGWLPEGSFGERKILLDAISLNQLGYHPTILDAWEGK